MLAQDSEVAERAPVFSTPAGQSQRRDGTVDGAGAGADGAVYSAVGGLAGHGVVAAGSGARAHAVPSSAVASAPAGRGRMCRQGDTSSSRMGFL